MAKYVRIAAVAVIAFGFAHLRAEAQGTWTPRPTLSPYLDYFRTDTGLLPQYQQFVRPKMQLRDELVRQNGQLVQQQQQISNVGRNLSRFVEQGTRPTGSRSVFGNHSHYYQLGPAGRRR
ncbi:MAG: hypothetical protein U0795_02425 [Pirellulales bacterium]